MSTHEEPPDGREQHDRLADEREQQADKLEQESERLGDEIDKARDEWEQKRRDPGVPGAVPPDEDRDREPPEPPATANA